MVGSFLLAFYTLEMIRLYLYCGVARVDGASSIEWQT